MYNACLTGHKQVVLVSLKFSLCVSQYDFPIPQYVKMSSITFIFKNFHLFLAVCRLSLVAVSGLLIAVAFLVEEHRL